MGLSSFIRVPADKLQAFIRAIRKNRKIIKNLLTFAAFYAIVVKRDEIQLFFFDLIFNSKNTWR